MARFKILGIAGLFCVLALGIGMVVGRIFSTGALPTGTDATAMITESLIRVPTQTTIATAAAATITPMPTQAPAAPTELPLAATPIAPEATALASYSEYTIQKGDILYTLAQKFDVTVDEIVAINDIPNPQSLSVGQVIRIPKK